MRNRKIQRELKRMGVDELLGPKNYVGISDPTPAQAVNNIRMQVIAEAEDRILARKGKDVAA